MGDGSETKSLSRLDYIERISDLESQLATEREARQTAERERNSARIEHDRLEGLAEAQDKALAAVTRNTDSLRAQLAEERKDTERLDELTRLFANPRISGAVIKAAWLDRETIDKKGLRAAVDLRIERAAIRALKEKK